MLSSSMGAALSTKKGGGLRTPNLTPSPSGLDPLENLESNPSETFRYLVVGFGTSAGYVAKVRITQALYGPT